MRGKACILGCARLRLHLEALMHSRLFGCTLFAFASLLCACGGGAGGNPVPISHVTPTIAPTTPTVVPTSGSNSSSIGSSGGTVSVTFGSSTATLTVPPGALSANATVTFTASTTDNGVHAFAQHRGHNALFSSGTFLAGFTIDDGGVPLYKTLTISIAGTGAPQGAIPRLAMYGTKSGGYNDVDLASNTNGTLTNSDDHNFVGISTASASNPYVFYAISASPGPTPPPSPITLSATTAASQPLPILSSVTFTGAAADANGNPLAFVPSYSLDSASVGVLTRASAPPYGATLQTGNVSAAANIVVTDSVRNLTGKSKVNVGSQRPTTSGDSYNYTGSWAQTFARGGQPNVTTTATLADAVTVTGGQTFNGVSGLYDFNAVDNATSPLSTSIIATDEYDGVNLTTTPIQYNDYGVKTNDGLGDITTVTYATPQLIDQLPETSGATWTNSGAQTLAETDADGNNSTLIYNANGTYTETTNYPGFQPIFNVANTVFTENADGSGSAVFNVATLNLPINVSAPASGNIAIDATAWGFPPGITVPTWYTTPPTLYSETDTNLGAATLPSTCAVGSSVPTSVNKLERIISRLDTIAGFTETQTIDSYVATGYGAVCVTITDLLRNYYNLQGDTPTQFAWYGTAYQTTTTTQTLAMQSTTAVGAQARSAMSRSALATFNARMEPLRTKLRKQALERIYAHAAKGAHS